MFADFVDSAFLPLLQISYCTVCSFSLTNTLRKRKGNCFSTKCKQFLLQLCTELTYITISINTLYYNDIKGIESLFLRISAQSGKFDALMMV